MSKERGMDMAGGSARSCQAPLGIDFDFLIAPIHSTLQWPLVYGVISQVTEYRGKIQCCIDSVVLIVNILHSPALEVRLSVPPRSKTFRSLIPNATLLCIFMPELQQPAKILAQVPHCKSINSPFRLDLSQYAYATLGVNKRCLDTSPTTHCVFFVSSTSWNTTQPLLGLRVNSTEVGCTWRI